LDHTVSAYVCKLADITVLPPLQSEPSNRCLILLYLLERAGNLSKWVKYIHLSKVLIIYTLAKYVTENMLLQDL